MASNGKLSTSDELQKYIGEFGKYQLLLILFMLPCKIPTALQPLAIVFLAPPVEYKCMDDFGNFTLNTCPCDNPVYDTSIFDDTIIMTWGLICDKKWLVGLSQTIHMLGILVGSIVFGALSDRYGRKSPLLGAVALELVSGVAAGLTPEFISFLFFRFLIGSSVGGILIVSFVLVMEFTGREYRELASALLQIPFNAGYVLLPIFGYFIRSWKIFQLAISVPAAGLIFIYWFLPETPRWLLTAGKTDEAIKVAEKAAKINKKPVDDIKNAITKHSKESNTSGVQKGTMLDLVRTPNMRRNTICVSINWIVCSFGFFGLSQYIGLLGGDIFVNIGISAGLNVAGTLLTYLSMRFMTRKVAMISLNLGSAACLFTIAVIPDSGAIAKVILACVGNVGMFVAFIVIYLYSTELFPTVVRNVGMGVASMLSRVGSMIAPFVVTLGSTAHWLPPVIFGLAPILAAILCMFLPETKGRNLPDTIEEGEMYDGSPKQIELYEFEDIDISPNSRKDDV